MPDRSVSLWADFSYHFDEIISVIHIKAFIFSLPVAYSAHFLGDWHLLEMWFFLSCFDLLLGMRVACKQHKFSFDKIGSWSFKILVHSLTIIAVGILAHMASVSLTHDVIILNLYVTILSGKELASIVRNAKILKWPVPHIFVFIVTAFDKNLESKVRDAIDKIFHTDQKNRRKMDRPHMNSKKEHLPQLEEEDEVS